MSDSPEPNTGNLKYAKVWQRARFKLKFSYFLHTLIEKNDFKPSISLQPEFPYYIIQPESKFKMYWSGLISVTLLYTALVTPYVLSFYESSSFDIWEVIDLVLDLIFLIDIVINSLSAYVDSNGVLVVSFKKILKNYLKTWLVIDLLSCIPFSLITILTQSKSNQTNKFARFLRLPRLYKLLRMSRLIKVLSVASKSEILIKVQDFLSIKHSATRFFTSLTMILIVIHIVSCLWYYSAKLDDFNPNTWVVRTGCIDLDTASLYITCVYWAITTLSTVGYGDISAYTESEKIISMFWMLVSLYFLAFTIGSLSSMSSSIDTKEKGLSKKLAMIDEFITVSQLDKDTARKLRHAIRYSSKITGFSWTDKHGIFNELPKSLKYELCRAMHHGAAKRLLFFENRDSSIISAIVPYLVPLGVMKKENVYKKGDPADEIYFLVSGSVNYFSYNENKEKVVISEISQNDYFGDIEVIFQISRKYWAQAIRNCELLYMRRYILSNLKKEYFAVWDEMRNAAIERDRKNIAMFAKKTKRGSEFIRKSFKMSEARKYNLGLNDLGEQIVSLFEMSEGVRRMFEKIKKPKKKENWKDWNSDDGY